MIPHTRAAVMKAINKDREHGFTREQTLAQLAKRWDCSVAEIEAIAKFKQKRARRVLSTQEIIGPKPRRSEKSVLAAACAVKQVYEPVGEEYERRKAAARALGNKARQKRQQEYEEPAVEVQVVSLDEMFGRQR